ncbi:TetR/AcrR family transcriptional regulator [Acerihabitans arboris]|uniref:TetR family transcriptional regulator n=1 Tax=Acerihabitans arboris TaxID=2691583 RepID=A0A845SNQ5_9GAMM|nr:TetR/AcrR family transcriptional regulator [Acerihabitans arboris]NDL64576.1 TetR family transcriptional regulator [Acerihabitans arboris]
MTEKKVSPPARSPGRPREFDIDRALDQAILTFRSKGYTAASIGDLSQAMELSAGSIYKAFSDKRSLFLAAFDRYTSLRNAALADRIAAAPTGRERLRAVLQFYAESSHDIEGRRGCLVAGSATGLDAFDPELAGMVAQALYRNESLLAELIDQGKTDGSIPVSISSGAAARIVLSILLGMRVVGKTGRTLGDMAELVALALKILD